MVSCYNEKKMPQQCRRNEQYVHKQTVLLAGHCRKKTNERRNVFVQIIGGLLACTKWKARSVQRRKEKIIATVRNYCSTLAARLRTTTEVIIRKKVCDEFSIVNFLVKNIVMFPPCRNIEIMVSDRRRPKRNPISRAQDR